jgi:hypothetical protein
MTEPKPGDQISFWGSMAIMTGDDLVSSLRPVEVRRGTTITLTADIIRCSKDKNGESWLSTIDSEDEQIARWGRRMISRGPWDESIPRWEDGTVEQAEAREKARQAALALEDPRARKDALAALERVYGPPQNNQTLAHYKGDNETHVQPRLGVI